MEAARAAALATAYVQTYVRTGLPWEMHGAPIDWPHVVVDETRPAYFAQGLYAAIADTFPAAFDRAFGPQYIVPLYLGDAAVASVSVAARTTDLRIDSAGVLIVPDDRVNDGSIFLTFGIPQNAEVSLPISPERAARELSLATGAKIAEVPILWQPRVGHAAPHRSRWEMVLDESIEVELIGESRTAMTNTVFVSSEPWQTQRGEPWQVRVRYEIPADIQPTQDTVTYIAPIEPGGEPVPRTAIIDALPGSRLTFVSVTP